MLFAGNSWPSEPYSDRVQQSASLARNDQIVDDPRLRTHLRRVRLKKTEEGIRRTERETERERLRFQREQAIARVYVNWVKRLTGSSLHIYLCVEGLRPTG